MILRRVISHVRNQEWTAIGIDFLIVVVGVFVGLQVSNWNAAQAERARERLLLSELRAELAESIDQLNIQVNAFNQVGTSGKRAIAFLDAGEGCDDDCGDIIVDFFQASQWQQVVVSRSTYDEMRRNGWPRNRAIVDALEAYHRQADQIARALAEPPAYRSLVRGLIPLAIHEPYWLDCFELKDGEEIYIEECLEGVDSELSAEGVAAIVAHPDVYPALTEWAGYTNIVHVSLGNLIAAAERAIALIDVELGEEL